MTYYKKTHRTTTAERKVKKAYCEGKVCEACMKEPAFDAHHICSEGSGGVTEDWNLLALCRICHNIHHMIGWKKACSSHPHLAAKITTARIKMGRSLK